MRPRTETEKWYQTRRFHRAITNKRLVIGGILIVLILGVTAFGPMLTKEGLFALDFNARLAKPSWEHPFGCDDFGRDLLSRIIHGSRISLFVGFVSQLVALLFGSLLGLIAGFYGKYIDSLIMRCMDVLFTFPSLLLAIALMTIFGAGTGNIVFAIGIVYLPAFARIVRGSVLSVKEKEYIESARALGMSDIRLITRHILPNIIGPIIIYATMGIGDAILTEAGLSFLGLGIQPPNPSWGGMLANGKNFISTVPYEVIFSGLAIVFTVIAFNTMGDGIRDFLDPNQNL